MLTHGTLGLVGAWCTALRPTQVPSGAAAWRAAAWPAPARWRHRARRRPCMDNAKHGQLTRTAGINEVCIRLRLHQPCVALVAAGRAHFWMRFAKRAPSMCGHGRLLGFAKTDNCQNPARSSARLQCSSRLRHLSLPPSAPLPLHFRLEHGHDVLAAAAGLFALWACGGGGGGVPARLLAVEPLPPNLALLRRNLRACAPAPQARPRPAPAPQLRAPPRRAAPARRWRRGVRALVRPRVHGARPYGARTSGRPAHALTQLCVMRSEEIIDECK